MSSYGPACAGAFLAPMAVGPIGLAVEGLEAAGLLGEARIAATVAEATGTATVAGTVGGDFGLTEAAAASIWKLGWGSRGNAIEQLAGQNLPSAFPVIDTSSMASRPASSRLISPPAPTRMRRRGEN